MGKEVNENKNIKNKTETTKKTQNKKDTKNEKQFVKPINTGIKLEILCIVIICISLLLVISVFFNSGGFLGKIISSFLKGLFGIGAYILPLVSISFCIFIFFSKEKKINIFKFILSILTFIILITFFHILSKDKNVVFSSYSQYLINEYNTGGLFDGGIIGSFFGDFLLKIIGTVSSIILLIVLFIATIVLLTGKSFFVFIKDGIKKISNYFYYEYSIKEEYEDENLSKVSIFSIIKEKIQYKLEQLKLSKEEKYLNEYDNDFEEDEDFENYNDYEEEIQPKRRNFFEQDLNIQPQKVNSNKRILKKQKDFIYDGNDTYIKIEKPTFFNISEPKNKIDGKINLALDEINKVKIEKQIKTKTNRNEMPQFFNPEVIKNRMINFEQEKIKDDIFEEVSEFDIHNYYNEIDLYQRQAYDEYEKELNKDLNKEEIEDNLENNNILQQNRQNIFDYLNDEQALKEEKKKSKVLKREDFYGYNFTPYNRGQTVYTIDFDIPSRKEIDELFSTPPEDALSENIDFEELNKLDEFYDFEGNVNLDENTLYNNIESDLNNEIIQEKPQDNLVKINEDINPSQVYEQKYTNLKKDEYIPINQNNLEEPIYKNNVIKKSVNQNKEQNEPIIIKAEKQKILNDAIIEEQKEYQFPKLSFLAKNSNIEDRENDIELRENSNILVKTLKSFNVNAQVINISKGPSVTRYEIAIEDGIKVSKILGLSDNLALSLAASSIRIEAPIPGKSAVGIEIPNQEVTSVFLSEVICSEKFQKFPSKVAFGLGKDITGNVIVTDIAKMPHMLIAGSTGSGKSVCINTLITSILYKASPEEVRLMMIDPKVVELSVYNGIPHLLTPVVTEPEKAAGVLNWAVNEMMDRYNLFAETGTRNLVGYNQIKEERGEEKLPQIVIIIDELADLMMVAAKEVEASICRLAQLARAAGMHLIIATQRPSVDVITGLIKANVPSRIAFAVSSGTDSRTVIDSVGAEKLLGKGDMLFKSVDMNKPLRIQGAFISEKEVEKIVTFIKENNEPKYDESIINKIANSSKSNDTNSSNNSDSDELTEDVIAFLVRKGKASTSMIQRQFRIGYNRAARIIEELEDRGIISSENGSKQRDVLMDKYQYEEYLNRYNNY